MSGFLSHFNFLSIASFMCCCLPPGCISGFDVQIVSEVRKGEGKRGKKKKSRSAELSKVEFQHKPSGGTMEVNRREETWAAGRVRGAVKRGRGNKPGSLGEMG